MKHPIVLLLLVVVVEAVIVIVIVIVVVVDDDLRFSQLWSEFLATEWRCIVFSVRYELTLYMLC
jgi:hypothetical protein